MSPASSLPPIANTARRWIDFARPALDAASIVAALGSLRWATGDPVDDDVLGLGLLAVSLFMLAGHLTGLHRRNDAAPPAQELVGVLSCWVVTLVALALIAFLARDATQYSRLTIVLWALLTPAVIGLTRMSLCVVLAGRLRDGVGVRQVAIAGLNPLGVNLQNALAESPELGMRFTGFYDDRDPERLAEELNVPVNEVPAVAGGWQQLLAASQHGAIQTVMITLPMRAEHRIRGLLDDLSDTTASVYIIPDLFVFELLSSGMTQIGPLPAMSIFENPLAGVDASAKRVIDLSLAVAGLLAAGLPMLIIAAAVKWTSPGPVFFRQKRYGLDGREILVWKFRSMSTCDNGPMIRQATVGDTRITPLGAILRRTSLDELPQLFNVIAGNMSLVGPRPHASAHNEAYRGLIRGYMLRHKVKPGITGLAQVNGCRGETETVDKMQRRVELDHQYIRRWSLGLDLHILVKTLWVAWRQPEAR